MDQQSTTQKAPRFIVSDFSSDEAQVLADGALYYQTSMGPQFVLAKIPTMQIGHKTYNDILVQNKLISSITDVDQSLCSLNSLTDNKQEIPQNVILEGLGIYPNYLEILEKTMKDCHSCK